MKGELSISVKRTQWLRSKMEGRVMRYKRKRETNITYWKV